jgi:acetyl esterase/lipase
MDRRDVLKQSVAGGIALEGAERLGHGSPAEEVDPVTAWATMAAYEFLRFPDHEHDSLSQPDIVYGRAGGIDLRLDVFTAGPETEVRPTLLFIHGGGWVLLMKEDRVMYLFPYLAQGMNAVNVEYRLANQALAPAAVEDCRRALYWVHQHAKEYGFDTRRLVVAGESAGGHLALMMGMLDRSAGFDNAGAYGMGTERVGVAAVVNFFGITDVADLLEGPNQKSWAVEWFGSLPDRERLAKHVSPLTYVREGLPPIISIHGTNDAAVPYEHSVRLHEALDRVGVPNRLVTIPNADHGNRRWARQENLYAQTEVFKFLREHRIL